MNELAGILARVVHKNIAPEVTQKFRVGDIRHCFPTIEKMKSQFNWSPKRDFEAGMAELVDWVKIAPRPVDRMAEAQAELRAKGMVI